MKPLRKGDVANHASGYSVTILDVDTSQYEVGMSDDVGQMYVFYVVGRHDNGDIVHNERHYLLKPTGERDEAFT